MIRSDALSLNGQQLLERIITEELTEQITTPDKRKSLQQTDLLPISIDVQLAKTIAKQIYDSKGLIRDDIDSTVRAIKRIKDAKQFELVQTELKKLTSGKGIGQYIASFLGTKMGGIDLNTAETKEAGRTIRDYLKKIKADPKTIKIIDDQVLGAAIQSSVLDTMHKINPGGVGSMNVSAIQTMNSLTGWIDEHDTWDSFINGTDGLRDMVYYDWRGIMATTIIAAIPQLKVIDIVIFGVFIVDDIKRFSERGFQWDILLELIFDTLGLFFGAVGGKLLQGLKAALNPIAKGLTLIFQKLVSGGVTRKIIEQLIKLIMPIIGGLAKSKIGQLIARFGGKIGNLISRVTNAVTKAIKSLIRAFIEIANKLKGTKFYKKAIAIVKMLTAATKWIIGSFIDAVKWVFKTIWAVISFPGKSIARLLEKLGFTEAAPVAKRVFNVTVPAYILQNYEKWIDEYREKTGVYAKDGLIDAGYAGGMVTFKQQDIEHVAFNSKGKFNLPVKNYPWLFVIVEQKGKWTKIVTDDGIIMWVKTTDIAKTYEEVKK